MARCRKNGHCKLNTKATSRIVSAFVLYNRLSRCSFACVCTAGKLSLLQLLLVHRPECVPRHRVPGGHHYRMSINALELSLSKQAACPWQVSAASTSRRSAEVMPATR